MSGLMDGRCAGILVDSSVQPGDGSVFYKMDEGCIGGASSLERGVPHIVPDTGNLQFRGVERCGSDHTIGSLPDVWRHTYFRRIMEMYARVGRLYSQSCK